MCEMIIMIIKNHSLCMHACIEHTAAASVLVQFLLEASSREEILIGFIISS